MLRTVAPSSSCPCSTGRDRPRSRLRARTSNGVRSVALAACLFLFFIWVASRSLPAEYYEYRFLRRQLRSLPAKCRIASIVHAGRTVLYLPEYAAPTWSPGRSPFVEITLPSVAQAAPYVEITPPADVARVAAAEQCTYYVHTSLCSTSDGRAACAAFESSLRLQWIAGIELPPVSTRSDAPYELPPRVDIGRVSPMLPEAGRPAFP